MLGPRIATRSASGTPTPPHRYGPQSTFPAAVLNVTSWAGPSSPATPATLHFKRDVLECHKRSNSGSALYTSPRRFGRTPRRTLSCPRRGGVQRVSPNPPGNRNGVPNDAIGRPRHRLSASPPRWLPDLQRSWSHQRLSELCRNLNVEELPRRAHIAGILPLITSRRKPPGNVIQNCMPSLPPRRMLSRRHCRRQPGAVPARGPELHDGTIGYAAGPGYDLASGLGSSTLPSGDEWASDFQVSLER